MPSRVFFLPVDYKKLIYENYEVGEKDVIKITETTEDKMSYFYDQNKMRISMHITMYEVAKNFILPEKTALPCWWCGYSFSWSPIGVFLNYVSPINDNIKAKLKLKNVDCDHYFETEGIFCSEPCSKAFVIDSIANYPVKYKRSLALLTLFDQKVFGHTRNIPVAGSWKLLEKWGGPLSIEEFRNSFGIVEYCLSTNQKRQAMFIVGNYVEENKIKT